MPSPSKRGICVPWNFDAEDWPLYAPSFTSGKLSWVGNWEMWKPQGLPSNAIYVPQCRTAAEAGQIGDYLKGYENDSQVGGFLGFNEPDIKSQANMDLKEAADLWRNHALEAKKKCGHPMRFGSPGVSNGPDGLPWLKGFMHELGGLQKAGIDHIVLHYYGPDVEHFKKYVEEAHKQFGLPVWVTEIGCTRWDPNNPPTEEEVLLFMRKAVDFLDQAPYLERYAWFGAMKDVGEGVGRANGLQEDGALSEAGKLYMSL